jgi:hypothetical protein
MHNENTELRNGGKDKVKGDPFSKKVTKHMMVERSKSELI